MKLTIGFLLCITASCFLPIMNSSAQETLPPGRFTKRVFTARVSSPPLYRRSEPFRIEGKMASQYTAADWAKLIDSTWGPGQSAADQLSAFDTFWNAIDQQWVGFPNLSLNWDSLRAVYRPQIGSGLSRGRFYALMSRIWLALLDRHTYIIDEAIESIFGKAGVYPTVGSLVNFHYSPGVPLLRIGTGWLDALGAAVTPMPDSSALVYRVAPGNPLGLKPGDLVLGYEGIPWKRLYRQLLDAGMPVSRDWSNAGSSSGSNTHMFLSSVGSNWGLFDTIDIVKYSTGDTLHFPTAPLATLSQTVWASEQMPLPGVSMPPTCWIYDQGSFTDSSVSWGVVQGPNIGYVYVWDWYMDSAPKLFSDAIYDLCKNKNVKGLVIDFRMNRGGDAAYAFPGLSQLFNFDPTSNLSYFYRINSNHLDFSFGYQWTWDIPFTPTNSPFDRPIALLIGPACGSAGDFVATLMRFRPNVRFFGKPTNGGFATGVYYVAEFNGWRIDAPTVSVYSYGPGEGYLIHKGVRPDEEVWLTRDGVAQGKDDVVERALAWINATIGVAEGEPQVPGRFTLSQNYPNPFNPATTIRYALPHKSQVLLAVYNTLGQQVASLVQGRQEAGAYEVKFDASGLASGMYYYRLQAESFVQTKKLLLLH